MRCSTAQIFPPLLIKKYIGAYVAVLGRLDALVFTGGIGEHASTIGERACEGLAHLGIAIDASKNESAQGDLADIGRDGSPVRALVVHTEEGREIAMQTVCTIQQSGK